MFTTAQDYTSSGAKIQIASQDLNGTTTTTGDFTNNRITFDEDGEYLISWNINWQSNFAGRSVFGATGKVNGTTVEGGCNVQYFRYNTYGQKSTTATTFAYSARANDYLEFFTFLFNGTPNHRVTPTDSDDGAITITRLT